MMESINILIILSILLTILVHINIVSLNKRFQTHINKLSTTGIISEDEANYLILKNDLIAESGINIPFYNIIVLIRLKTEYQMFLNFYIKKIQEKELKGIK